MGKMIETPRTNILSFRVSDWELEQILDAQQGGHKGTHIRKLVFEGLEVVTTRKSKEPA